jgi:hypothetical protein
MKNFRFAKNLFLLKTFRLFFIFTFIFIISCDDGNIIVSSFDFDEETNLSLCQQDNINVLYFIDSETNEAISFKFTTEDFDGTFSGFETEQTITINLNATNEVIYRKLSASAEGDSYFCQEIPPSSPQVIDEFVSTTGGTASLEIRVSDQDDNDGVPPEREDINNNGDLFDDDSDGDGIPNFLDTDDDNDNVVTAIEAEAALDENGNVITDSNGDVVYVNTDGDVDNEGNEIPDYLDDDDDNDNVATINEDLNVCEDPENPALNPANDLNADGLPNYLNQDASESITINVNKNNTITRTFFTQVVFNDITFENRNNDESLTFTNFIMGRYTINNVSQVLPFNDTVISEDEAGNICQ